MPPKSSRRLTCTQCRSRKMRCDGAFPACGICTAYGKECTYDRPPSMAHVVELTDKIKELEKTVQELRDSPSQGTSRSPDISSVQRQNDREHSLDDSDEHSIHIDQQDTYHDTTSAIDAPTHMTPSQLVSTTPKSLSVSIRNQTANIMEPDWEETAIANCAVIIHLPPDKVRHLLATHWAWVHPTFMFIDRLTFLRDAATGGRYFSPLLLSVICLHSTRFTDHELSERLWASVKLLLGHQIHEPPTITTLQSLLQLSAREIGRGSTSQAWLYSGMAFRMATDMGLFATRARIAVSNPDPTSTHLLHRLGWSCYLWDKTMSMYLGRAPTLLQSPDELPEPLYPSYRDDWYPYGISASSPTFVATTSHAGLCFGNFCKLGIIICDVLTNLYGQRVTNNAAQFVYSTRARLKTWYQCLPETLRTDTKIVHCQSPHILTQNILYHATTILLLRPFRKATSCRTRCREASNMIKSLFLSMERTHGFTRVTYLMAYCAYIAATVAVQDARDNVVGASQTVETFVRVLSGLRATCPSIQRSLDIIAQSMQQPIPQKTLWNEISEPSNHSNLTTTIDEMPMFPVNCLIPGMEMESGIPNVSFTDLDPYTYQWFNLPEDTFDDMSFNML